MFNTASSPTNDAQDDAYYLALKTKDARFDGHFFTGVTSTGIYCRPVCRVRTPQRNHCRFFELAAQAQSAGFRPCLRCRPELAPRLGLGAVWSLQDSSAILARQAAQLLDNDALWGTETPSVFGLALRMGVSVRHLHRIFKAQFGISPIAYLQTRRLLAAKQWLSDTDLPMAQIAKLSGFGSVRHFNASLRQHYQRQPSALRRLGHASSSKNPPGISTQLAYRPPYDVLAMLRFWAQRALGGTEWVSLEAKNLSLLKTLSVTHQGQLLSGWIQAQFQPTKHQLVLHIAASLQAVLPWVLARVRTMFDLDADPAAIHQALGQHFPHGAGLRLPGCLDGFELAVRAVLGQQISVRAAQTLGERLVAQWGTPIKTPFAALERVFPSAQILANASTDALGQIGIIGQRQRAIQAIAQAVLQGQLHLHPGAPLAATLASLQALPGVGDWTANYIALRALSWPDAFLASDVALHRALGLHGQPQAAHSATALAQAWRPWRSYAVIRAWAGCYLPISTPKASP
jgi:AraC family transcriptional regulator of adaptative response / DNA-3-methyladenine glycosylase II